MKPSDEPSQLCPVTEQNLPPTGTVAAPVGGARLDTALTRKGFMPAAADPLIPAAVGLGPIAEPVAVPATTAAGLGASDPGAPPPATPAHALEQCVLQHVVQLREVNADSMAVVVHLDHGTEVLLQLRQTDGQVSVFAQCERGNAQHWGHAWGQLQTAMAEHGVRVASLNEPPPNKDFTPPRPSADPEPGGSGSGSERPPQRPVRNPLDDLPMVGSVTEPLKRRPVRSAVSAARGWEWWA